MADPDARRRAEEALRRVLANAAAIVRLSWSDGATPSDRANLERIKSAAADIAQDHKILRALLAAGPGAKAPGYDRIAELESLLRECNAVCLCGCPESEHESYGEDGESCVVEGHDCVRTSRSVAAMLAEERRRREEAEAALRHAARELQHIADDDPCEKLHQTGEGLACIALAEELLGPMRDWPGEPNASGVMARRDAALKAAPAQLISSSTVSTTDPPAALLPTCQDCGSNFVHPQPAPLLSLADVISLRSDELEQTLSRIEAACGIPNPADACRTILALCRDARAALKAAPAQEWRGSVVGYVAPYVPVTAMQHGGDGSGTTGSVGPHPAPALPEAVREAQEAFRLEMQGAYWIDDVEHFGVRDAGAKLLAALDAAPKGGA